MARQLQMKRMTGFATSRRSLKRSSALRRRSWCLLHICWRGKLSIGGVGCGEVWILEGKLLLGQILELDSWSITFRLALSSSESRSFWLFSREVCPCKTTKRD
ncbi:hypothetical protein V8G54_002398 [Vigna mungo]|uniref:Uncharacterized protein n=1 Tax=Vigna mungo TaxID=3915 RepID=A0AAQ3SCX1_VIGMU